MSADSKPDGFIYTVEIFRDLELDDPANHGGSDDPIEQLSREIQAAMEQSGLPAGLFKVRFRRSATWAEWDARP